jgi:hypothetical protein
VPSRSTQGAHGSPGSHFSGPGSFESPTRRTYGFVVKCEFASETAAAMLRVLLKVKPGMGEGYDSVECGSCSAGWQIPHYAESVG